MVENAFARCGRLLLDDALHDVGESDAQLVRLRISKADRKRTLRVGVDQQDAFSVLC
ncbi:hypothetical protein SDC9_197863 [bioreactor metagenome]|uniref:Uncharacterized protein n=1 Tax=bioreactor metagenome TaxID=1076179 RepID=A0A645IG18_9ZZZZ